MIQPGVPLVQERKVGVLIVGSEDAGRKVAGLMADTEYSVLTVTPDQLVQELNRQDYDLAVLDLSGTQQEEGPLVDQALEFRPPGIAPSGAAP